MPVAVRTESTAAMPTATAPQPVVMMPTVPLSTLHTAPVTPSGSAASAGPVQAFPATSASGGEAATSAAVVTPVPVSPPTGSGGSATELGLSVLTIAVTLLVLLAVAVTLAVRHRLSGSVASPARKEVSDDPDPLSTTAERHGSDIRDLIHSHDLAGTPVDRHVIESRLALVGVRPLHVTPGDPVDPSLHHVVDVTPAAGSARIATVGEVIRPGWVEGDRLVRVADIRADSPRS